jgi:hypothetical protein
MEERTKRRLRHLAILVGAGAGAGIVYMPFLREIASAGQALRFAAQGALIVFLVFGFEFFVAQGPVSAPLRRPPFVMVFFAKALITTVLIVIASPAAVKFAKIPSQYTSTSDRNRSEAFTPNVEGGVCTLGLGQSQV